MSEQACKAQVLGSGGRRTFRASVLAGLGSRQHKASLLEYRPVYTRYLAASFSFSAMQELLT